MGAPVSLEESCASYFGEMKNLPDRRMAGPCFASQVARCAASRRSSTSANGAGVGAADEAESVFIAEPVVARVKDTLVYFGEQRLATLKAPPDVSLGNVVAAGGDTASDSLDGEVGRRHLDEVQHRQVASVGPPRNPRPDKCARRALPPQQRIHEDSLLDARPSNEKRSHCQIRFPLELRLAIEESGLTLADECISLTITAH